MDFSTARNTAQGDAFRQILRTKPYKAQEDTDLGNLELEMMRTDFACLTQLESNET
jgi:hypothetical protein